MKIRTSSTLALLLAVGTAGLSAQQSDSSQASGPAVLTDAIDAISSMHMEEFDDSLLWEGAIDGLIAALDDPYAEIFTPEEADEWEEATTGNYSGIGLQITLLNEAVTVTGVFRGFPASEMGIQVGDVIVGVNGHDASDWSTGMTADSIRGPEGTEVHVDVLRKGYDEPFSFDITREEVHMPAVSYGVLEGGIGYVGMDRVARNAAQEMNEALHELGDQRGLIIDLRRNPGGFLDESLMLADLFLEPGSTLASTVQRNPGSPADDPETDSFTDRWPQLVPDLPIIILVDEYTASGAEILAGALQDYDRALVLGQRTFGKGVVQTVMPLPHGRRLRFTTGSWLTPLGRSLQRERDNEMRPLEEDVDTLRRVTTPEGRTLVDGGGIFPDLPLADDTLKTAEQAFLQKAVDDEFPLNQRIVEYALDVATQRLDSGDPPRVTDSETEAFRESLVEEGLDPELLEDPDVQSYLDWRVRVAVAQRMDDLGAEADLRRERDPVLQEAVRLLTAASTQAELFSVVDEEREAETAHGAQSRSH
ncbi:MAG: S41 family peptidase [Gemmatimonadota bacterium]|nr:S41 family peptidase [Gemmatimonadota bacterium]